MIFHTVFLKLKLMILTGNHIYLVVPFHQWSDSHWYPHFLYHLLSLTFLITLLSVNFSAQTDFNYSNILTSSTNVPLLPSDHPFITHWPSALHFMHIHIRIRLPSFLSLSLFCISVSLLFLCLRLLVLIASYIISYGTSTTAKPTPRKRGLWRQRQREQLSLQANMPTLDSHNWPDTNIEGTLLQ